MLGEGSDQTLGHPDPCPPPLPLGISFSHHQTLVRLLPLTRGCFLWVASILCCWSRVLPLVPPSL